MEKPMHKEIAIKVNAWVDEGIAPLVLALNQFDCLLTVDSCEGGEKGPPYVYLKHMGSSEEAAVFVARLAEFMGKQSGDWFPPRYEITIGWIGESPGCGPLIRIETETDYISAVTNLIILADATGVLREGSVEVMS